MMGHDLTAQEFGTVRTAIKTRGDSQNDVDVGTGRWTNYGKDRLYINDLFTSTTDAYVDLETGDVVVDGTKTRTTDLEVDGDELVITIKRPSSTYEIRVEITSIDGDTDEDESEDENETAADEEDADAENELIADGGQTTAERADDIEQEDFDLSKREVAELAQYGPEERIGGLNQEAYDTVIDEWQTDRPEALHQIEDAECFDWVDCYWEVANAQGRGTEFTIMTGVEPGHDDDDRKEIRDLAWDFVSDWIDEFYRLVAALQKKSNFGRQEFRAYWLGANLSKSEVAQILDVTLPTRKGYWDRALAGIGRARATDRLTFDHGDA